MEVIRKEESLRCGKENSFSLKDIYEELFKRVVIPVYIVILSLISCLLILKSKNTKLESFFKFFIFIFGFIIIIFSELSYKLLNSNFQIEIISILMPIIFIFLFYIYIFIKTNFNFRYL